MVTKPECNTLDAGGHMHDIMFSMIPRLGFWNFFLSCLEPLSPSLLLCRIVAQLSGSITPKLPWKFFSSTVSPNIHFHHLPSSNNQTWDLTWTNCSSIHQKLDYWHITTTSQIFWSYKLISRQWYPSRLIYSVSSLTLTCVVLLSLLSNQLCIQILSFSYLRHLHISHLLPLSAATALQNFSISHQ